MILSARLGVEDRQTTTAASNTNAQQFAEAMNDASASPQPASGQPQCNVPMYHKGLAEYATGGTDAAVGAAFAAQALQHDGPIAAAMVAAPFVIPALYELGSGSVGVAQSRCLHSTAPTLSTEPQFASTD